MPQTVSPKVFLILNLDNNMYYAGTAHFS